MTELELEDAPKRAADESQEDTLQRSHALFSFMAGKAGQYCASDGAARDLRSGPTRG